jgi:hypothetical protein
VTLNEENVILNKESYHKCLVPKGYSRYLCGLILQERILMNEVPNEK